MSENKDDICGRICDCSKCLVDDEPEIDYEIEVIKRKRYDMDGNIRKMDKNSRVVGFFNISRLGVSQRVLKIYTKTIKMLKLDSCYPSENDLSQDPVIIKTLEIAKEHANVRSKKGSKNRGEYAKTVLRKVFVVAVARGLIPIVATNKEGNIILVSSVIRLAEDLAAGAGRYVARLCDDRSSCLRRIIEQAEELGIKVDLGLIAERAVEASSLGREAIEYIIFNALDKDISESKLLSMLSIT